MKRNRYMCRIAKKGKIGEVSSKYAYDKTGERFIADMQAHEKRAQYLWDEFVKFMKTHNVIPEELRSMFVRYFEQFISD